MGEFRGRKRAGPLLAPTEEEPVFGVSSQDPASVGQPWVQMSIGVTESLEHGFHWKAGHRGLVRGEKLKERWGSAAAGSPPLALGQKSERRCFHRGLSSRINQ